jgi:hypothetical protein
MQGLSSGAIDFYTIPTEGPAKIGGADVIKVDPKQVNQFVADLTGDERSGSTSSTPSTTTTTTTTTTPPSATSQAPGKITVDVRNASAELGLASAVQSILRGKGYLPGTLGDSAAQTTSALFYKPGGETAAQQVATELGGQFKLTADSSLKAGEVRVVLGKDFPTAFGRRLSGQTGTTQTPALSTGPSAGGSVTPPSPSAPAINANGVTCVN